MLLTLLQSVGAPVITTEEAPPSVVGGGGSPPAQPAIHWTEPVAWAELRIEVSTYVRFDQVERTREKPPKPIDINTIVPRTVPRSYVEELAWAQLGMEYWGTDVFHDEMRRRIIAEDDALLLGV